LELLVFHEREPKNEENEQVVAKWDLGGSTGKETLEKQISTCEKDHSRTTLGDDGCG
jgi:hypothetical protein